MHTTSITTAPLRFFAASSSSSCSSSSAAASISSIARLSRRTNKSTTASPLRCSSSSEMEANAGTAMYPLRCKTIYLVRHAQGIHNVEGDKDYSAYMSAALFDAHLTPLGWNQLVPGMMGFFAYKAAASIQVYRDNEDLRLILPEEEADIS